MFVPTAPRQKKKWQRYGEGLWGLCTSHLGLSHGAYTLSEPPTLSQRGLHTCMKATVRAEGS